MASLWLVYPQFAWTYGNDTAGKRILCCMYNWVRECGRERTVVWESFASFVDVDGVVVRPGERCHLLVDVVAFDEKGGECGVLARGSEWRPTRMNLGAMELVYLEGSLHGDVGWGMGAAPPEMLRRVAED